MQFWHHISVGDIWSESNVLQALGIVNGKSLDKLTNDGIVSGILFIVVGYIQSAARFKDKVS